MASFTSRLAGWAAGRLGGQKAKEKTMDWMGKTGVGKVLSFAGDSALTGAAFKGLGALKNLAKGGQAAATAANPATAFDALSGKYVPKGTEFNPVSAGAGGFQPTTLAQMPGSAAVQAPNMAVSAPPSGLLSKAMPARGAGVEALSIGRGAMQAPVMGVPQGAFRALPEMASPSMLDRLQGLGGSLGRGVGGAVRGAVDFAKANPQAVGKGLEAYAALQQNQAAQNIARERIGLERQQMEQAMEQRRRMAEALQPLLAQLRSRMGGMG